MRLFNLNLLFHIYRVTVQYPSQLLSRTKSNTTRKGGINMSKKNCGHYSGIGGQAVLEGVMMKNKDEYAVAVRKPDGNIEVT